MATVSHVVNRTCPVARSLRTRLTHVIGVVVSNITNPFFATLVRGVEDAAIGAGYSLIVCNFDEDLRKEDLYVNMLRRRRMDGLLIAPVRDGASPAVQELSQSSIPHWDHPGDPGATTAEERYAGYRKALQKTGSRKTLSSQSSGNTGRGYRCTQELLVRRVVPTAIFSTNNL